jgi:hypothetical protein
MLVIVGLSLTNHCLNHSEIFFKSVFTMLHHKNLGITLSADCKWSNHINTIFGKTSKQVTALRKLKFKVSRNFFETMYLTCIRPLLEYAGEANLHLK